MLACARGERFALQALYEREARWLLGLALRIVRDRERAEEVLHDSFLQVWQQAGSYQPGLGSARSWIYTLVRHRALKESRDPARMQPMSLHDPVASSAPATGTPEVGGLTSWEALTLVRSLAGATPVGADIVEVSPPYDGPGQITALLAANLAFELLGVLALER